MIQLCDVRGLDMEQFEHVQQVHCEAITCICDTALFLTHLLVLVFMVDNRVPSFLFVFLGQLGALSIVLGYPR